MRISQKNRSQLILIALVLALGILLAWWSVRQTDGVMRNALLQQASLAAKTISYRDIMTLAGNSADLKKPQYQRFKRQLAAVRQAGEKYRFVYLMGQRDDGTMFFYADSEPVGSRDESPAGQRYDAGTAELHDVFRTGRADTEGPVSDQWGTFISGLAPIIDPVTKKVIAVLGIDIDTREWQQDLGAAAVPAALLTLVLMAVLISGYRLKARRTRLAGEAPRWMCNLESILALAVGLSLTGFFAVAIHRIESQDRQKNFTRHAASRTLAIEAALRNLGDIELESLARFYEGSEVVTPREFAGFTGYLVRNAAIQAWAWIPVVPAADRSRFEKAARQAGMPGFRIWQEDGLGGRIPATDRREYYPVFLAMPVAGNEQAIGFDLGSEKVRRTAIEEAVRTGLATGSGPIRLVQEPTVNKGVLVFRPVFDRGRLLGLALAVLRMKRLLENADPDLSGTPLAIALRGPDGESEPLAGTGDAGRMPDAGLSVTHPIFAFGSVFAVTVHADSAFLQLHPVRAGLFTALAAAALSVSLALIIGMVVRRKTILEELVAERTRELHGSREQLSATLRSIGDGVIACDVGGAVVSLNAAAEHLTGWPTAEAVGQPVGTVFRIVNAQTRESVENPIHRTLREGITVGLANHTVLLARDGTEYQIADSCAPIRDEAGNIFGAVLIFRDVSDEHAQRAALAKSELRFRAVLECVPEGIIAADIETGRFVFVNAAMCRMLGYAEDEFSTLTPAEIHPAEAMPRIAMEFEETALRRSGIVPDIPVKRKDGSLFSADIQRGAMELEGRPCMLCIFTDITERKRAGEEREKLQDQLNQAQKMESIGWLAGGVAHDFNNMLAVIFGHAERAMQHMDPGLPLYENLAEIRKAAERSADVARQLLAFARKQTIAPQALDLNETVEEMLRMLGRLIGEQIHLIWQPGKDLPPVRMDPSQVDQILINLCINARDAIADTGTIMIETGSIMIDETYCNNHPGFVSGDFVQLTVSDDGCGMNREVLANIFEPFFSTKGTSQNTGLGLATVYGIVKQNNGFINAYSEPGHGTRFTIYLPRHSDKAKPGRKKPEREEPDAHGDETILLVEDEPAIRKITRLMLEKLGYTVLIASAPDEAIRLVQSYADRIDLLITDVIMPGMNGRDLAEKLLALHPHLKCLFMSGYTANVIAHHGVLDKEIHFLQKPFFMKDLALKIREMLEGRQE